MPHSIWPITWWPMTFGLDLQFPFLISIPKSTYCINAIQTQWPLQNWWPPDWTHTHFHFIGNTFLIIFFVITLYLTLSCAFVNTCFSLLKKILLHKLTCNYVLFCLGWTNALDFWRIDRSEDMYSHHVGWKCENVLEFKENMFSICHETM